VDTFTPAVNKAAAGLLMLWSQLGALGTYALPPGYDLTWIAPGGPRRADGEELEAFKARVAKI
jgi:hypothetical protein